jgi:hypothetical protein
MAGSFRNLTVYKKAFTLAMKIFEITKKCPTEEKYELTSQIRRPSRAVCRTIGEGYILWLKFQTALCLLPT